MPLAISCSSCGAKLRAPDNAAGRTVNCPKCGSQFLVAAVTASRGQQHGSIQSGEVPDDVSIKRQADSAGEAIAASKLSLGFGIASLALSVIGMVFSLIPCIGAWFAIPLCGLGLLLGIVGTFFALNRQGRGIGVPLAGSITGFTGIGIAIMWLTVCSGIFSSGARSVQEAAKRAESEKKEAAARKNSADAPKKDMKPYRLAASVTWTDPDTRQIGLQHGGIPGAIIAGNHRFSLAPEAPWPNVVTGQKVECVMKWRNGQWVVSQVNPAQGIEPAKKQPFDIIRIESFLGISPDFKAYAMSDASGVKVVDLETGKNLASPKWDRDWGTPLSAAFGKDVIAVVTVRDSSFAVKVFSRKSGELEQNIHGYHIDRAAFTADGRFLAITEFRPDGGFLGGYHLVLRDIPGKKTVAEVSLGSNGYCSLAVAGQTVAAYESDSGRITVVEAETGKVVKDIKTESFRKRKGFGGGRMPLAISPAGDLIACEAEDTVVLYDIASGKVAHKLEGHLDTVRAVAFSPNGETIASAAKDKTIRFWGVKQGKEVRTIKNLPTSTAELIFPRFDNNSATELIFSTDGNRIAVVSPQGRKAEIRSVEPK